MTTYEQFEAGFIKEAAANGADPDVLRGMIAEQADLMQKWSAAFDEIEQQTGDKLFRYKLAGELSVIYADNARMVKEANADWWPIIQQWLADPNNQKMLMGAGGGGLLGMLLGGNNKLLGGLLGGLTGGLGMYGWNNGWFNELLNRGTPEHPIARNTGEQSGPPDVEQGQREAATSYTNSLPNGGAPTDEELTSNDAARQAYEAHQQQQANQQSASQVDASVASGGDQPHAEPQSDQTPFASRSGIEDYIRKLTGGKAQPASPAAQAPLRSTAPNQAAQGPAVQPTDPQAAFSATNDEPANPDADNLAVENQYQAQMQNFQKQQAEYQAAVARIKQQQAAMDQTARRNANDSVFGVNLTKPQPEKADLIKQYGVGGGELKNVAENAIRGIHSNVVQPLQVGAAGVAGALNPAENTALKAVGRGVSGLAGGATLLGAGADHVYQTGKNMLGEGQLLYNKAFKTPPPPKPLPMPTPPVMPARP